MGRTTKRCVSASSSAKRLTRRSSRGQSPVMRRSTSAPLMRFAGTAVASPSMLTGGSADQASGDAAVWGAASTTIFGDHDTDDLNGSRRACVREMRGIGRGVTQADDARLLKAQLGSAMLAIASLDEQLS